MDSDLYRLLGVSPDAPEREIKRAYYSLARKMHPDKAESPEEAHRLEEQFASITRAYNMLKDGTRRGEYDAKLKKNADSSEMDPVSSPNIPATGAGTAAAGGQSQRAADATAARTAEAGKQSVAERSFSRGLQLLNRGNAQQAVEFFDTAIRNNPADARFHARLAQALMRSQRGFTRSVEAAQRACHLDQYNIEYKMILALIYERAGSNSLAIREYEHVLKWDQGNAEATRRLEALRQQNTVMSFKSLWASLMKTFGKK